MNKKCYFSINPKLILFYFYSSAYEDLDLSHGMVHESPDTHAKSHNSDYFKDLDQARPIQAPIEGGGGGGGATIIFRVSYCHLIQKYFNWALFPQINYSTNIANWYI